MKIIYNHFLPFPGFSAMMLFGVIFARKSARPLSARTINHEAIHAAQARARGGWLRFYAWYIALWMRHGYRRNPFEVEAYDNDHNPNYLNER